MPARVAQRRGPSKYNYKIALKRFIIDRVFRHFGHLIRRDPVRIRDSFGVPTAISLGWYRQWLQDSSWRPYKPNLEMRRRMSINEQEEELATQIRSQHLRKG
jgi:hypothetical protein